MLLNFFVETELIRKDNKEIESQVVKVHFIRHLSRQSHYFDF